MIEFSTWELPGFRMSWFIMDATNLADACFMCYSSRVLYFRDGGIFVGGPLSNIRGITESGWVVWAIWVEINLRCVRAGSRSGDIIGTIIISIVTSGVGDIGMGRAGAAVWIIFPRWYK